MREIQLRWSWKTHDFLSGILEAPTCRKLESVLLVAAGFPPPQRIVEGKKWRNSWNLEITKVQVQGKMFDISEQKIAQFVSGCGWLSFFNIYHLFLQVNDGIILKLKVLVPVNFLTPWIAWKTGTRNWRSAWHLTMKSLSSTSPNMAISWVVLRTRATYARKVFCTLRLASATKGLYFERLFSKSLEIENVVYFKHFSKISQASCQGCPSCGFAEIVWVCQQSGTTRSL